jgi:uncharacterized membrane protein YdfJ with MMPL/SSD domain
MDIYTVATIAIGVWAALALLTALAVGPVFARGQAGGEPGEDAGGVVSKRFHADTVRDTRAPRI